MKRIFAIVLLLGLCPFVFAQNLVVEQSSFESVTMSFTTDTLYVENVAVGEGTFSLVSMEGYGSSYDPGAPQLPQLSRMMQIPVCDSVIVNVVNALYEEYDAADLGITHPLWPSQPSVSKSTTNPPFAYDQTVYGTNAFYALPLVSVEMAGIRRDIALANVYVTPVQYNPVTQRVRIYTRIDVVFTFANANLAATNQLRRFASPMFTLDTMLVVNELKSAAKTEPEFQGAPIKYLIVANSMFSSNSDLAAFVTWKRRLGYLVEVAYTSDASVGTTTTSIKNYIQNRYNNATATDPAPTFLLLVGDVAQIPAFASTVEPAGGNETHYTDLYYATLAGSDNIPDCYYGRLSATNATQLKNQLDKILMYEQYTMPDPSYLGRAVLVAGTDNSWSSTHANGQINYASNYVYANTTSTPNPYNFTTVYKHLHNCSSQAATIRSEIGAGVGFANYTAHGSEDGWYEPAFETSHIASMQNADKYGLLIGNCCLTGSFQQSECFAEALLRTANKGAMGYIGASKETYWDQDVYWAVGVRSSIAASMSYSATNLGMYDRLFHKNGEAYAKWVSTIGGILQSGNLAVQASSSSASYKQYYWEIYHCFGDPSVRVYLGIPNTMTVTANATLPMSSTSYSVQAVPYAYVALKRGTTEFVAAGFANATGYVTLTLPSTLEAGNYELVALAQNYIPYFQNVEVVDDGACPSPTNLTVSNLTPFTAVLSWTGSGDSYTIQKKTSASSNWTTVATGVTVTSYTLTGLQENTAWQVRVQSVCGNETSYWNLTSFTTPEACPAPTGLSCSSVTSSTANLTWTENGTATSWILQYGTNSSFTSGTYTQVTVSGAPAKLLSGLTAETTYYARVKAVCGGDYGQSQWSEVCTFLPTALVEIGSGTATGSYLPTYNRSKYSLTQQIYTVSELGSAGEIGSISFYKSNTASCNRTLDIYMVSTTKSSFSGSSDWITVTAADKVYSGTVNFANNAWTTIQLNTPFAYDGTRNVAVIVDDNSNSSGSIFGSSSSFLTFSAASQAIRINGSTNYNPSSPSSYSGTVETSKNQIRITKTVPCPAAENVLVSNVTGNSAVVSWEGVANSYTVRYRTAGSSGAGFFEDFEGDIGDWTVIRSGGGNEYTDWRLFDGSFSSSTIAAHSGTYMIIGRSWASEAYSVDNWLITPAVTLDGTLSFWVKDDGTYHEHYDVYVSTSGNDIDDFTLLYSPGNASADWTEVTVDLSGYHGVTGYIAIRLTDTDQDYLLLDDFGIYGNDIPAGEWQTVTTTTSTTATITGLAAETEYEVQVVANCGSNGQNEGNSTFFTTDIACPAPGDVTAGDITATSANLSWTGVGSYNNLRYRVTDLSAMATVILTAGDVWGDGSGYQMLLDADATAYGTIIPETGGLTDSGDATPATYAAFEYKIPANADGACNTANVVYNNSITIQIPAGVYDWCITNPTDGDRIWIASSGGNVPGRGDNYLFEGGHTYQFVVSLSGSNDQVTLTDTDNGAPWTVLNHLTSPYGLTGLTPNTSYQVAAQTDCGADGQSVWGNASVFTTDAASIIPTYVHISGENSVCQGQTTTLTATSDVEVSYHWSTGETTASITVSAGTYVVTVTSASGNSLVSEAFTVTENHSSAGDTTAVACESFVWEGETYTESGDYMT